MVSLAEMQTVLAINPATQFQCRANLNLYDAPALQSLATQAVSGRQLTVLGLWLDQPMHLDAVMQVRLCEDDYPGWVPLEDLDLLEVADASYQAIALSPLDIESRLPQAITFAYAAMQQPNHYLWGGTVGPNYDCSGLTQSAFASVGIWLPRDAYQQEAFTQAVLEDSLQAGDLVFFGSGDRCTHVGIYLGNDHYIHSSGKDQGRNGIGIDRLSMAGDAISQVYYQQWRGGGRVVASYVSDQHSLPWSR